MNDNGQQRWLLENTKREKPTNLIKQGDTTSLSDPSFAELVDYTENSNPIQLSQSLGIDQSNVTPYYNTGPLLCRAFEEAVLGTSLLSGDVINLILERLEISALRQLSGVTWSFRAKSTPKIKKLIEEKFKFLTCPLNETFKINSSFAALDCIMTGLVCVNLNDFTGFNDAVPELDYRPPLQQLSLKNSKVTDDWVMAILKFLPCLGQLILERTQISDRAFSDPAKCGNLQQLNLKNTNVTDAGLLLILEKFQNLRGLHFGSHSCKITDNGLQAIPEKYPNFRHLSLEYISTVTYIGLTAIKNIFPCLKHLSISGIGTTGEGIARSPGYWKNLRELNLFGIRVIDTGIVAIINQCPKLQKLYLGACDGYITEVGLAAILNISPILHVELYDLIVTTGLGGIDGWGPTLNRLEKPLLERISVIRRTEIFSGYNKRIMTQVEHFGK